MRLVATLLLVLVGGSILAQRARIVTTTGNVWKNVTNVVQEGDLVKFTVGEQQFSFASSHIRKITFLDQRQSKPLKPERKFQTILSLQLYTSKPSKDLRAEEDPALMLDFAYKVSDRVALGVGTGLQSPHFNTTLAPIYIHSSFKPVKGSNFFFQTKLGKFIPMSPDFYEGGSFSEFQFGYDIKSRGRSRFRTLIGYSHQRMERDAEEWWWISDREITYRFNRMTFGFGLIF